MERLRRSQDMPREAADVFASSLIGLSCGCPSVGRSLSSLMAMGHSPEEGLGHVLDPITIWGLEQWRIELPLPQHGGVGAAIHR